MREKYFNLFLIALLIFSSVSAFAKQTENQIINVEVAKAQLLPFKRLITVTGTLRANQGIMVKSEIAGRISKIYFKSGDNVTAGTLLIQLNRDVLQSQLQQSLADVKLAEQNYDRMVKLYKTRVISKADFDDVTAKLNTAKAKAKKDQAFLDQASIKAPFAGKLGLSSVNLGDYLSIGQEIVNLEAINPIEVEFNVPQVYLSKIKVGQEVKILSDAYVNQNFIGKIYAIDAKINENNRTFAVRATIPNMESKLLPGAFVEVNIEMQSKEPLLLIPQVAVIYDVGQAYVFKVFGDKVTKTKVTLGERDKENVAILSGLNANDVVVTAGQLNLQDKSLVRVTK